MVYRPREPPNVKLVFDLQKQTDLVAVSIRAIYSGECMTSVLGLHTALEHFNMELCEKKAVLWFCHFKNGSCRTTRP